MPPDYIAFLTNKGKDKSWTGKKKCVNSHDNLPSVVDGTDTHAPHSAFPGPLPSASLLADGRGNHPQKTDLPG